MDAAAIQPPVEERPAPRWQPDAPGVAAWLLGLALVVYLSLKGGGYDSIVRNQIGIAIWWIVIGGTLVGALPLRRPGRGAWGALGLLGAYVVWTALSFSWTESSERTAADLGRVGVFLGLFALALFTRGSKAARRTVAALATGIAVVSLLALLSRLHPAWFENADQTGQFLTEARNRLSYPLNYWNGLAILVAIGMPLVLHVATSARTIVVRAAAAAALPSMALAIYFTYSRGGTIAATAGVLLYLVLASERVPKFLTLGFAGGGGAILIAVASHRDALESGLLNSAARDQGDELLLIVLVVCGVVGLAQAAFSYALGNGTPGWMAPSRRQATRATLGVVAVALLAAVAVSVPGRLSDAWSDFKSAENPGHGAARFESFGGNGRYQYWSSTLDENATDPFVGTGSGTFEYWWARNGDLPGFVRDAHSLYFETLGELGIVGFLVLVGFLATILVSGIERTARAVHAQRSQLGAAVAGCAAFCIAAAFDWAWELTVIPMAFLLLASVLVTAGDPGGPVRQAALPWYARALTAVVGIAAMIVIAI